MGTPNAQNKRLQARAQAPRCRLAICALGMAFLAGGCEKQAELQVQPTPKLDDASAVDASLEAISPNTSSLAAQSQRDVDLILKSRVAANAAESTQTNTVGAANPDLPRRTIVWNDPKRSAAPAKASDSPPATAPDPKSASTAPAPSLTETELTAQAAGTLAADRLKSLMVDLSRELYASGSYSSTPLRQLLMIAAMSMIDPQRAVDPESVPDLTDKERELLAKLQDFFAQLGRSLDSNSDTEAAIVDAVAKLRQTLVKEPTLRLPTANLCTRVGGFGDYSQFEKYVFLAQSQQKAILYLEIADFISELNPKGEYVTQIAQQLAIYSDSDGIPVWKEDWQTAVDVTKVKRQDFFTVQVITLPKALSVGKFHLKVRVRDEKSEAEAETSIPFEMVADPRMAVVVGK